MATVNAEDLMAAAGIRGINTLKKWSDLGLIPEARIEPNPDAQGTIRVWDEGVLARCEQIASLKKQNKSLAEILKFLGPYEQREATVTSENTKPYIFAEACKTLDRDKLHVDLVERIDDLLRIFQSVAGRDRSGVSPLSEKYVEDALRLIQDGFRPVLVISSEGVAVTADVAISSHLSQRIEVESGFCVVPLTLALNKGLPLEIEVESESEFSAGDTIIEQKGDTWFTRPILTVGNWGFELGRRIKKKKPK